jgi:hypothetical protein
MPTIRRSPAKTARAEMRARAIRLQAAADRPSFSRAAAALTPSERPSAWPSGIQELAGKIQRQESRRLHAIETPVTSRERRMLTQNMPRGIVVAMNDPAPCELWYF